jgi:hypothetical protein
MLSPKSQLNQRRNFKEQSLHKSAGILDDFKTGKVSQFMEGYFSKLLNVTGVQELINNFTDAFISGTSTAAADQTMRLDNFNKCVWTANVNPVLDITYSIGAAGTRYISANISYDATYNIIYGNGSCITVPNNSGTVPVFNISSSSTSGMFYNFSGSTITINRAGTPSFTFDMTATANFTAVGSVIGKTLVSTGDVACAASQFSVSNVYNESISTGVGSVKMTSTNARTNTGWIKVYANGNARYIPYWTRID